MSTIQHRQYFDRLASTWDSLLSEETMLRIGGIVAELNIEPASEVLDVGSGTGVLLPLLTKAVGSEGRIIETDISAGMLGQARAKGPGSNTHYIQADIVSIPFTDKVFDLVICLNTLPHCHDKLQAITEMARVTKTGGRIAICHTMSREAVNHLHQSIGGLVSDDLLPDSAELYRLLEQAGLETVKFEDTPERYLVVARRMS